MPSTFVPAPARLAEPGAFPQNPTMPLPSLQRQPDASARWFHTRAGQAVLDSEAEAIAQALAERPGQPWLWLSAALPGTPASVERGLALSASAAGFAGPVRCELPLPLVSDVLGTVVVQHVGDTLADPSTLLAECARVLVPGGRLWLFALNPLAPYRWRWTGDGPVASEPIRWRRRLRRAGLVPEPVSHGLGPRWRIEPVAVLQHGAGVRAAFLLRGEKRLLPLTPLRARPSLRWQHGLPAA